MESGSVLQGLSGKIVKANLLTVLLFAVLWGGVIAYYREQSSAANAIRLSAGRMNVEELEARRAEKDFLNRDLTRSAFYESALPAGSVKVADTNLEKWESRIDSLKAEIATMRALVGHDRDFDARSIQQLETLTDEYVAGFCELVRAYHRIGFKDWGYQGEWRKAAHELESSLKSRSDPSLEVMLLELRRDEKDYQLRAEPKLIEEIRQQIKSLATALKATPALQPLVEKTGSYEKAFDDYLEAERKIGLNENEGIQGEMRKAVHTLDGAIKALYSQAVEEDDRVSRLFLRMLGVGALVGLLVAGGLAALLGRRVARPITELAVTCQGAAAQLQAAANQQATGTREQATSMNEISTTINELLASSRQIAESGRRVAQMAENAGAAARGGDQMVQKSHESISGIRRQVDLIVSHMLDLGKKSQQIGGVLEIINELSEQTNILAINATIEAAGGGEAGKRFGVVADEIRKLADRVSASTKEIQGLIEEVRGAVNATVMTTETGSKAVDAGAQQFGELASAFKQIAGLVGNNSEAGKEIELTTKQQATAVEQVNAGVMSVGQASREMETSTAQTLQTASQLATLSRNLARLVNPATNGAA